MIIDCSSGLDDGVLAIHTAAALSLDSASTITLVGDSTTITNTLTRIPCDVEVLRVVHADQTDDGDSSALQRACIQARDSSRGPVVTATSLTSIARTAAKELGNLPGCSSPAAFEPIPVLRDDEDPRSSFALLGDIGLRHSPNSIDLRAYASLGALYAQVILQRERPEIALLSATGSPEDMPEAFRAVHGMLNQTNLPFHYRGLATPGDVFAAEADIIITDGYTGGLISGLIDSALDAGERLVERSRTGIRERIGIRALGKVFERLRHFADNETYGGTAVLGYRSPILALKPGASARAWKNAMILASEWERANLSGEIADLFVD